MSVLRIYNVSDYVYAGSFSYEKYKKGENNYAKVFKSGVRELPNGSFGYGELPVGGVSYMLNPIFENIASEYNKNDTMVFCIDSTPTVKRKMYYDILHDENGYKAGRARKKLYTEVQLKMIKEVLELISPNVFIADGYEADDIITTIVKEYKDYYDKIYIHAVDGDFNVLVQGNVCISNVGARGKLITEDNFSKVLTSKNGMPLPFNTSILEKLEYGDKSDNIPPIGSTFCTKIRNFITEDKYKYLTNFNLIRSWVNQATDYNTTVVGIVDLLLPLVIKDKEFIISDESINITNLCYIGYITKNKYCKKLNFIESIDSIKQLFMYYTDLYYMEGGNDRV